MVTVRIIKSSLLNAGPADADHLVADCLAAHGVSRKTYGSGKGSDTVEKFSRQ
jgi:hypothetical protein